MPFQPSEPASSGRASATPKPAARPSDPHRSDLAVRHTAKRADARECSTGEQKALLISMVLAHARELSHMKDGPAPILLLDEIAAHLDRIRRAALFEEIVALGAQAWMTGTDLSLFEELGPRAQTFLVTNGEFAAQIRTCLF